MQKYWIVEKRPIGSDAVWEMASEDWSYITNKYMPKLYGLELEAESFYRYATRDVDYWGNRINRTHDFRVRESTPDDWRAICAKRFYDGEWEVPYWVGDGRYSFISWGHPVLAEHFPHVAKGDPTKIAFVEDDAKGRADRITVMKPGRFLTKFFSDVLSADEIADLANKFIARSKPGVLHFATTADEIEYVYTNGPNSCMAHGADDYSSSQHPVRVYAAGDLAVAYVVNGDITARALCWPEKKIHGRIYGDADRLLPALRAAGFTSGSLSGARLLRIEERGGFICPYIDCENSVEDDGEYLRIDGPITADSTSGLIEDGTSICGCCGDRIRGDEYYVYAGRRDEETWCESCYENEATYCEHEDITVSDNRVVRLADGSSVPDWSDFYFECEGNGENYHIDDLVILADGTYWSTAHFEDHGATCAVTGDKHPIEDMVCHPELDWVHKDTEEAQSMLADADEDGTVSVISAALEVA